MDTVMPLFLAVSALLVMADLLACMRARRTTRSARGNGLSRQQATRYARAPRVSHVHDMATRSYIMQKGKHT